MYTCGFWQMYTCVYPTNFDFFYQKILAIHLYTHVLTLLSLPVNLQCSLSSLLHQHEAQQGGSEPYKAAGGRSPAAKSG